MNCKKIKKPSKPILWILIIASIILISVAAVILFTGDNNVNDNSNSIPTPEFTPFKPEIGMEDMVERLKASEWVDRLDPEYTLTFDSLPSTVTEYNAFANITIVYSLTSNDGMLYLSAGQAKHRIWLEEDVLFIDFGGTIGIVDYIPVAP